MLKTSLSFLLVIVLSQCSAPSRILGVKDIQLGMSEDEVVKIINGPYSIDENRILLYHHNLIIAFNNDGFVQEIKPFEDKPFLKASDNISQP